MKKFAMSKIELSPEQLQQMLADAAQQGAEKALQAQPNNEWLTVDEVLKMLHISRGTLWKYETRGLVSTNGHGYQLKRYSRESVHRLITNMKS